MSDDLLTREIAAIRAGFARSGNGNVGFLATEIARLMTAGYRLPAIETELRHQDAPIFLVALPLAADAATEYQVVHPAGQTDPGQLRFYLWIGINGWAEAAGQLAQAGIPAAANLANLDWTGFIMRRLPQPDRSEPSRREPERPAEPASRPEPAPPAGPLPGGELDGYLDRYLAAPDLTAAADVLRTAPRELYDLTDAALQTALRRLPGSDDLWRAGLLEGARERGIDAAYQAWRDLQAAEEISADDAAISQLSAAVTGYRGCLRDRALELLLERYRRTGDLEAQRAVAQELADHRSAGSPPGRRPLDLANLGLVLVQQGDLDSARSALRDAASLLPALRDPAWRGLVWLRRGTFARDYDADPATALHSFRAAAEEFRAADDLVAAAQALEDLAAVYRAQHQVSLAIVYGTLAEQALEESPDQPPGIAGGRAVVSYAVQKGCAQTDFLAGRFRDAYARATGLLAEQGPAADGPERLAVERLAVAAALASGDRDYVRGTATGWADTGHGEWLTITRATIRLGEIAVREPGQRITPDEIPELMTLSAALVRIGISQPDATRFLTQQGWPADFARNLLHLLAGLPSPEAAEAERASRPAHPATAWRRDLVPASRPRSASIPPLPADPSWDDLIERYRDLGVWQLPDLAVIAPVLDRWALRSRFDGAVRVNPAQPVPGSLNVYFWAADPDGQLEPTVPGCGYVPDGELLMCSLHYLDSLVRADPVVAEWVLAHEIGHAHFDQDAGSLTAPDGARAEAPGLHTLEEEADAFYLNGAQSGAALPGILDALHAALNALYELDCQQQFGRSVELPGRMEHPLPLDPAPDVTGHRPLVFRAVDLVRYILRSRPDLGDTSYIDQYATSLVTTPGRTRPRR